MQTTCTHWDMRASTDLHACALHTRFIYNLQKIIRFFFPFVLSWCVGCKFWKGVNAWFLYLLQRFGIYSHNKMFCIFIFYIYFFLTIRPTCDRNIKNCYENEFVNKAFWTQPFIVRSTFLKWTTPLLKLNTVHTQHKKKYWTVCLCECFETLQLMTHKNKIYDFKWPQPHVHW